MHSVLLVSVLISATFVSGLDVRQTKPCHPECNDDLTLNLSLLRKAKFTTHNKGSTYTYSPCTPLVQDECKDAVVCKGNSNLSLSLGNADKFQVSCSNESLTMTFTADNRSSVIILECSKKDSVFKFLSQKTDTYEFLLRDSYICSAFSNGTNATTPIMTSTATTTDSTSTTTNSKTDSTTNSDSTTTHLSSTEAEKRTSTRKQVITSTTTTYNSTSVENITISTVSTSNSNENSSTVFTITTSSGVTTTQHPHSTTIHGSSVSFQVCSALLFGALAVARLF